MAPPPAPLQNVRAIVIGASGACGRFAVDGLVRSPATDTVTTVVRHYRDFASEFGWSVALSRKHIQRTVEDFGDLKAHPEVWAGHTVVVCALGTTRAIAGSAESFVKVDRDYVIAAAEAARAAGIPRFLLLTAQGSGGVPTFLPRSVVSAIHPLLYTQTKYEAETAVKSQGFSTVSIFRPGLLDRRVPGADYRSVESLFLKVMQSTKSAAVGYAMAEDATTEPSSPLFVFGTAEIAALARVHQARLDAGAAAIAAQIKT
eukprot:m.159157 g.159157  ORF g.159157 m.159157 type:complete len:259 (+) comp23728_c1_seq4:64-840(+)